LEANVNTKILAISAALASLLMTGCAVETRGGGVGVGVGVGSVSVAAGRGGVTRAVASPSSASRCREGSIKTARIAPSPRSAAEMVKARA